MTVASPVLPISSLLCLLFWQFLSLVSATLLTVQEAIFNEINDLRGGGLQAEINAGLVMRKRLTITGSTLRARPVAFKEGIARACLQQVWPLLAAGRIKPVVHSVFLAVDAAHMSGSGASRAHALMESNQHIGKIILTWSAA